MCMKAEITHTSSHHGYHNSSTCIRRLILDSLDLEKTVRTSYPESSWAKDVERLVNGSRSIDNAIRICYVTAAFFR